MGTLLGTNISPQKGTFEDGFPFRKVGYVSSLEGMFQMHMTIVEYLQYKVYVKWSERKSKILPIIKTEVGHCLANMMFVWFIGQTRVKYVPTKTLLLIISYN